MPTRLRLPAGRVKRIVVARSGAVGDVLMTTPAIRGLRHRYPSAQITVRTRYPELFELNPHVDLAVRSIAGMTFDLYIWMRYEHCHPLREHITDIFCRCAGVPAQGRDLDLFLSVHEHRALQDRLRGFTPPVITLQPWPGDWTRNKDWLPGRWEEVVAELRSVYGATMIQLGTEHERLIQGAVDWRGTTTLREAALTILYATLHLGCDSAGQQFAHAVGTPAVILYGVTHPVIASYPEQLCLYGGRAAIPCYHRAPCEHRSALQDIQVSDVLGAVHRSLSRQASASRMTSLASLGASDGR